MPGPRHRWPGWWPRAATLLAHAQPAALAAVIATGAAASAVTDLDALAYAHATAIAMAVLTLVAEHYHQHRLCPRCAAATPADGAAAAQRRARWLRLHHWAAERATYALILLSAPVAGYGLGLPHWAAYPAYALWALVATANLLHRPVQPWCPHCRDWDWGEGDTGPVPTPPPAAGATR